MFLSQKKKVFVAGETVILPSLEEDILFAWKRKYFAVRRSLCFWKKLFFLICSANVF